MIKQASKTKLTLWVSQEVKQIGRNLSRKTRSSLSELFSNYLRRTKTDDTTSVSVSPLVKSLTGIAKGKSIKTSDYKSHLGKKY